jgi:hypothetical protein
MLFIDARNVNYAISQGVTLIHQLGVPEPSRAGDVLRMPAPVATIYTNPNERVLFHPWRDANPFFHLVEAIWMLAGRDDLKQLTPYVKRMELFSDDGGVTQPAAYGARWRNHRFEGLGWTDQLNWAVKRLRDNPNDRRVVIQMWDPFTDVAATNRDSKDVPCNLTALPWVGNGKLHLTVFNRSNDMIWGAYGANAVHFSVMLEYLACRLGLEVGTYTQISNNFHAYVENAGDPLACWTNWPGGVDPYAYGTVKPMGLFEGFQEHSSDAVRERILQDDLKVFFTYGWQDSATKARWPFLSKVVVPMAAAHQHWKTKRGRDRYEGALEILDQVQASDWRLAAKEWIMRRYRKWEQAADDGVQHV